MMTFDWFITLQCQIFSFLGIRLEITERTAKWKKLRNNNIALYFQKWKTEIWQEDKIQSILLWKHTENNSEAIHSICMCQSCSLFMITCRAYHYFGRCVWRVIRCLIKSQFHISYKRIRTVNNFMRLFCFWALLWCSSIHTVIVIDFMFSSALTTMKKYVRISCARNSLSFASTRTGSSASRK